MNKKHPNNITAQEWYIMNALWTGKKKSLMDITAEMKQSIGWSKSTCATMLRRMCEKELISYEIQGKTKWFYPLIEQREVIVPETKSFLHRIFRGSIGLMMNTLLEHDSLTDQDINELEEILAKAKKKQK